MALTALDLLRRADPPTTVVVGVPSCGRVAEYDFIKEQITILPEWAGRSDPMALLIALHEVAHARQPTWIHCLRWLWPVRMWEESSAWEGAVAEYSRLFK